MGLTEIKPTGNLTVPCHRSRQATVKNNGGLIDIYMYSSPRLDKKKKKKKDFALRIRLTYSYLLLLSITEPDRKYMH